MREALRSLLIGHGQEAERSLRKGFLAWLRKRSPVAAELPARRTVAQIDAQRGDARNARLQREQRAQAAALASRQRARGVS